MTFCGCKSDTFEGEIEKVESLYANGQKVGLYRFI